MALILTNVIKVIILNNIQEALAVSRISRNHITGYRLRLLVVDSIFTNYVAANLHLLHLDWLKNRQPATVSYSDYSHTLGNATNILAIL